MRRSGRSEGHAHSERRPGGSRRHRGGDARRLPAIRGRDAFAVGRLPSEHPGDARSRRAGRPARGRRVRPLRRLGPAVSGGHRARQARRRIDLPGHAGGPAPGRRAGGAGEGRGRGADGRVRDAGARVRGNEPDASHHRRHAGRRPVVRADGIRARPGARLPAGAGRGRQGLPPRPERKGVTLDSDPMALLRMVVYAALLAAGCTTSPSAPEVPLPAEAQWVWRAYWTAVERGDVAEWNRIAHSSVRKADATGFDPKVQADARSFLTLCSVQSESMAMGGDRASYRTRCTDGPTQSGLYPYAGAEIVLRRDVDGAWRFFCFGCGLPYLPQSEEAPLSPYDAQRLWVAFWSAVEQGDTGEVRQLLHSSFPREAATELARAGMAGEARTFL